MSLAGLLLLLVYIERKLPTAAFLLTVLVFVGYAVSDSLFEIWSRLGSDSFEEASNFDPTEAVFYLRTVIENLNLNGDMPQLLLQLLLPVSALFALRWMLGRLAGISHLDKLMLLSGCVLLSTGVSATARTAFLQFEAARTAFDSMKANFASVPAPPLSRRENGPLAVFVYIGESTSALNMQLYGYPRRTTPQLAGFAASDSGLITFERVFSTHTHTSPSLLEAFSLRPSDQDNRLPIDEQRRLPLVNVLARSGVRVALYSNQGRSGTWNFASSIVFRTAEREFSVNAPVGNLNTSARPLDRDFLPRAFADRAFSDDELSLVLFHSYAGHGPYLGNAGHPRLFLRSRRISVDGPRS
jgi:hypothetical protein